MNKSLRLQFGLLLAILLANFIAQVPYAIHLYGVSRLSVISVGWLMMAAVFLLFLCGTILFIIRRSTGYWLLLLFVTLDFLFYLWNFVGSIVRGYGAFFQLANPDPLLRLVFAIGYLNFLAAGYCLVLLAGRRRDLLHNR